MLKSKLIRKQYFTISFFLFALLSSVSGSSMEDFLFTASGFSTTPFWDSRNAEISSGQSKLSSGSQVLSTLKKIKISCYSHRMNQNYVNPKQKVQYTCRKSKKYLLWEAFPFEEKLNFPINHSLVHHLLHHKLLHLLRILLWFASLLLTHIDLKCTKDQQLRNRFSTLNFSHLKL